MCYHHGVGKQPCQDSNSGHFSFKTLFLGTQFWLEYQCTELCSANEVISQCLDFFLLLCVASYQERSKHSLFHSVETRSSPKWVTWVDSSEDSRHGSLVMPLLAFESHFCQPTQGPFPLPLHCSLFQPLVLFPHLFTGRFSCLLVSTLLIPLSSPSLVSLENFNHGSAGSLTM